jgi:ABC-type spermidine/putrescine transport system permease subunit II
LFYVLIWWCTSSINLIINKEISWSEYPIAICLIIFAYVTVFVFLAPQHSASASGQLFSCRGFFILPGSADIWDKMVFTLAIPLLLTTNLTIVGLLIAIWLSRQKGINLIAYNFLAATLLCIGIESILSFYLHHHFRLWWSLIVSACVLPVMVVLLLMHYRYKRGRDLQKTFHL